jgi:hypothetical protein
MESNRAHDPVMSSVVTKNVVMLVTAFVVLRPLGLLAQDSTTVPLGAATGVLAVHLNVRQCEILHPHSDGPPCAIGYTITPVVALSGAGIGAVIGRSWPANRWRAVAVVAPAAH